MIKFGVSLEDLGKAIKGLRESNPYPADVFIEPTTEQYKLIAKLCKENGLTLDKFSGSWGRKVWNNCLDELSRLVNNSTLMCSEGATNEE